MRALVDTPYGLRKEVASTPLHSVSLNGARAKKAVPVYEGSHVKTVASIAISDLAAHLTAILGGATLIAWLVPTVDVWFATNLWPVFIVAITGYALWDLYPGLAVHPAEEFRRTTIIATTVFAVMLLTTYATGLLTFGFFALIGATWALTTVTVPAFRAGIRSKMSRKSWWGYPVVVLGAGPAGRRIVSTLRRTPTLGLRPVAVLDDDPSVSGELLSGVPVLGGLRMAPELAVQRKVPYGIIAMPGAGSAELGQVMERYARYFKRLLVLPDLTDVGTMWAASRAFDGMLGFEMYHYRENPALKLLKRAIDMIGALIGLIVFVPIALIVAFFVKLDSPGPVFFRQLRMGKDGRCFEVYKFRSMYVDAEKKLQHLLNSDREKRYEYDTFHKLRDDPRVTRVGKILRRLSLDELPQLWNVLRGEMSLVGPRAYLPRELCNMSGLQNIILRTPPGLTGLWQVSGRNDLCFKTRLALDVQYTRDRSIWFDIYLIAKTLPVVLTGKGAS